MDGIKQRYTYSMLKEFKNHKSNNWLALAEFIDNSIAAYNNNKISNNDVDGLHIKITFDGSDKNNKKIIVEDNASGMDKNKLQSALELYNTIGKNDSSLNQYGVGMKTGIFWHGQDVKIYSKTKNGQEQILELLTSDESKSDEEVIYIANDSNENKIKYESGTRIEISNVYNDKWISDRDIKDEIKPIFGWRYKKQLKSGLNRNIGMDLSIKLVGATGKTHTEIYHCASADYTAFKLHDFIKSLAKKADENTLWEKYNDELQRIKKESNIDGKYENIYCFDPKLDGIPYANFKKKILTIFLNKLENNEELEFKHKIFHNNHEVEISFGIIDKYNGRNMTSMAGLSTFHAGRAIHHPPNNQKREQSAIVFTKDGNLKNNNPTWRHLYGEIDLTGIWSPDNNKSNIQWNSEGRQNLQDSLYAIWESLQPLLQLIVNLENYKNSQISSDKDKKQIAKKTNDVIDEKILKAKYKEIEKDDGEIQCEFYYESEKNNSKIFIFETNDNNSDFIKIDSIGNDLKITFDINHNFIKPIYDSNKSVEFKTKTLYPMILLLALCCDKYDKDSLDSFFMTPEDKDIIGSSLEKLINYTIKKITKE